jgi:thymidylate synthase ThyX
MRLFLNAQEIINISKVRLCNKAEKTTREIWRQVIEELSKFEPELAAACVPSCIYRGHCPEIKSCGLADSELFTLKVNDYIKSLN